MKQKLATEKCSLIYNLAVLALLFIIQVCTLNQSFNCLLVTYLRVQVLQVRALTNRLLAFPLLR